MTDDNGPDPKDPTASIPEGLGLWIAVLVVVFMGLVIAMAVIQTHAQ
jgi:hypothetical protein